MFRITCSHVVLDRSSRRRDRRGRLPRPSCRGAPPGSGRRCAIASQRRLRSHRPRRSGGDAHRVRADRGDPPGRSCRRDRLQHGQPCPAVPLQPLDGHARDRGSQAIGDRRQDRARRHRVLVPEDHAGPVQRGRPVGGLSRGDQRSLRHRQEGPPRPRPGQRAAVRAAVRLSDPDEPLRTRRQVPSIGVTRDPGADQEGGRSGRVRCGRHRRLGNGRRESRIPVRRRCRCGDRARRRGSRRHRADQPRRRPRGHDPRDRRDDRRSRRLRRRTALGCLEARRPAPTAASTDPEPRSSSDGRRRWRSIRVSATPSSGTARTGTKQSANRPDENELRSPAPYVSAPEASHQFYRGAPPHVEHRVEPPLRRVRPDQPMPSITAPYRSARSRVVAAPSWAGTVRSGAGRVRRGVARNPAAARILRHARRRCRARCWRGGGPDVAGRVRRS